MSDALHTIRNINGGKDVAITESTASYVSHGIRDGHGGETDAIIESKVSDGSHGIGDGHGGKAPAISESRDTDASHGILHALVGKLLGDNYRTGIIGIINVVFNLLICYFRSFLFRIQIIVNAIYLAIIGTGQQGKGQKKREQIEFFHIVCFLFFIF